MERALQGEEVLPVFPFQPPSALPSQSATWAPAHLGLFWTVPLKYEACVSTARQQPPQRPSQQPSAGHGEGGR